MPLIPFPNVPNVPGVPALLRSLTVPTPGAVLNRVLGAIAADLFGQTVWGVFDANGDEVLNPDSFGGIDYQNGGRVSNAPQEEGAFSSYNKVANPYDCSLMLITSADKATRSAFLAKLEEMSAGVELFTVVTPERTYTNATLQNFNYKRNGQQVLTMIQAQLNFVQIRTSASSTVTPTQDPSGADIQSGGQVQLSEPSADEIALVEGAA